MIDFIKSSSTTPNTLWRYLAQLGWEEKNSKDGTMKRFTLVEGDQKVRLFFTREADADTTSKEVAMALSTLEQVYGLSPSTIVKASASSLYDLIKATIPDNYVINDTINLKTASLFIKSVRDFLASSATTEDSGEKNFLRNSKFSIDYANDCRFGHTFKGSFGFIIESPVGSNNETTMPFIEPPLPHGRKVVNRIRKAFEDIKEAKYSQSLAPLLSPESAISSNMCDDIVSILEDTGLHKVNFSFEMSKEWGKVESYPDEPFFVEVKDIEMLKAVSNSIRGSSRPKDAIVIGMVSRLETSGSRADIFDDRASREIIINWDSQDYGRIKVKISLNPDQYLEALRAHSEGIPYRAEGSLLKEGRSWILVDIQEARAMN